MTKDEIIAELEALIAKLDEADEAADTAEDEARMSELLEMLEERNAKDASIEERSARIERARAAIEEGSAQRMTSINFVSDPAPVDEGAAYKRAWLKTVATRGGITLAEGNELTAEERTAFTHLTTNTGAVMPTDMQDEIISLIERSAVVFGDIRKSNFKHVFELVRHASIAAGDAAPATEGAAPANDEQNTFVNITLAGVEIKKTVKLSRKLAVQSMDGFEQYIIQEIADRCAVAADTYILGTVLTDETVGIDANNVIETGGDLEKSHVTAAIGATKSYGAAPKGRIVYANSSTIWNQLANLEDGNGRSYFVDEKTEDPTVQGRIFGCVVKADENIVDNTILIGYPDTMQGNIFDGVDVTAYVATDGSQNHCFDGYLLFDAGMREPKGFALLKVTSA